MIDNRKPATGNNIRRLIRDQKVTTIYHDLAAGVISTWTTLEEVTERYGRDSWRDYKEALRAYGYDHGCLVLVDDENDGHFVAMMEHFGRDIAPEEASAHFSAPLAAYVSRQDAAIADRLPENVIPLRGGKRTRFSVYRLPFGDYSGESQPFFDKRGEFIWETYLRR